MRLILKPFYICALVTVFLSIFVPASASDIYCDGFDFPVGNTNDYGGWYISLSLGQSWYCNNCNPPRWYRGHLAEDFLRTAGTALGQPVYAAANGIIDQIYTGSPTSWGGVVIIKHKVILGKEFDITGCTLPGDPGEDETSIDLVYTMYCRNPH